MSEAVNKSIVLSLTGVSCRCAVESDTNCGAVRVVGDEGEASGFGGVSV